MVYFQLIRIKHWIKNLFILFPLFFSGEFLDYKKLTWVTLSALGFSLVTSLVYIINDVFDKRFDQYHPDKRNRPIASGRVPVSNAMTLGSLLAITGFLILFLLSKIAVLITFAYLLLNLAYSFKLKNIAILDFTIIAIGFVIRIILGSVVGIVLLTDWMLIVVFLLSLFIAISKRRDDVVFYEKLDQINRKVVLEYNISFMDKIITITTSLLLISYLMFVTDNWTSSRYPSQLLNFSFLFVLIGVFRYNQLTFVKKSTGSPIGILLKDFFLQLVIGLWVLTFVLAIYIKV